MHLEIIKIGTLRAFVTRLTPPPGTVEQAGLQTLAELAATKSEPIAVLPPEEMPDHFHIGQNLNWASPLISVDLYVELPYWILVAAPSTTYTVTVEATSLQIEAHQEVFELLADHQYRNSHSSTVASERIVKTTQPDLDSRMRQAGGALTYRAQKTTLCIHTNAHEDVIDAYAGSDPRRRHGALRYLQTLAYAHLPFLNKLISAYQRAAEDPYAHELAESDVPFWYISAKNMLMGVPIVPYLTYDQYPYVCDFRGNRKLINLTSERAIQSEITKPPIAGHIELVEAWGMYYRGRSTDAVRILATSIELSLEAVLKQLLQEKGLTEEQIEKRLAETFNDFEGRFKDYVSTSGRAPPGPILSMIPVINGVRLKSELDTSRRMRHKVVHEGMRIDHAMAGSIQRAMETTTWLYQWLNASAERPLGKIAGKVIYNVLAGEPVFQWTYTATGVLLKDLRESVNLGLISVDARHNQLLESIDGDKRDLELCVRMFFNEIKTRLADASPEQAGSICKHERFVIPMGSPRQDIPVFLFDLEEFPLPEHLHTVAARLLERASEGLNGSRAFCVFNYQNGAPWRFRKEVFADEAFLAFARKCCITVLSTVDMLLIADAARRYGWSPARVVNAVFRLGRGLATPPGYVAVGTVRTFFAEPKVLSINVNAGADLRKGDTMLVRLKDRYHEQVVDSLQQNGKDVQIVAGPNRAGVQVPLERGMILDGGVVYVNPEKRPQP